MNEGCLRHSVRYDLTKLVSGEVNMFGRSCRAQYLRVPTVDEAKQIFGPITNEERRWRNSVYFDALLSSPRSRLGIGEHDRSEAYIFGNSPFPYGDRKAHKSHFPVSVKVVEFDELALDTGEVCDLSVAAEEFPWPTDGAELYLHLIVKKLVLASGSKLIVRDNVFVFNCAKAIGHQLCGEQACIELGSSNNATLGAAAWQANASPQCGHNGRNGGQGQPLSIQSTPLGDRLADGTSAFNGQAGEAGGNGESGDPGANGGMLFHSDIRFGQLDGFPTRSLKIKAGAAPGLPGVDGARGGNGGRGGKGADGKVTPFGVAQGCPGGPGGQGGKGGDGGKGGNGGLSCAVFLSVPYECAPIFDAEMLAAPGGRGGLGGKGGLAGVAGEHGAYLGNENSRFHPPDGEDGANGQRGRDGKTRPAPRMYIYERLAGELSGALI